MAPTVLSNSPNPGKSSTVKHEGKDTLKSSSASKSTKNKSTSKNNGTNGDTKAMAPPPPRTITKITKKPVAVATAMTKTKMPLPVTTAKTIPAVATAKTKPSVAVATAKTNTNSFTGGSAFRIKKGCVVALRFRSSGNTLSVVSSSSNSNKGSSSSLPLPVSPQVPPPVTTAATATAATSVKTHKVVSLDLDESLLSVWTNPLPGRDSGLALIGKHVRCFFPKQLLLQLQQQQQHLVTGGDQPQDKKRRVLEGEIVSLMDDYGQAKHRRRRGRAIRVALLVDKKEYQTHFPFLQRLDQDVDLASLPTKKARRNHLTEQTIRGANKVMILMKLSNPATMAMEASASTANTATATNNNNNNSVKWVIQKQVPPKLFHKDKPSRKRSLSPPTFAGEKAETKEKGITGESPFVSPNAATAATATTASNGATEEKTTTANTETADASTGATSAVVNRKQKKKNTEQSPKASASSSEPPKKRRKLNTGNVVETKHVGDGNDPHEQQISNWRWLAGRYHDLLLSSNYDSVDPQGADVLSGGLVGEVLKVESSPDSSSSLATVTLRRLFLPEHTATGRLPHHGPFDIFEDYDAMPTNAEAAAAESGETGIRIQVPVENVIIISRRLEKIWDPATDPVSKETASLEELQVSHAYSLQNDTYFPLVRTRKLVTTTGLDDVQHNEPSVVSSSCCHRCRKSIPEAEATTCTSNSCPLVKPGVIGASITWCESCLEVLRSVCSLDRHDDSGSAMPCCLGLCDCRSCRLLAGSELQQELLMSVADAAASVGNNGITSETRQPLLLSTLSSISSLGPIDFDLPSAFVDSSTLLMPTGKPATKVKARNPKNLKRQLSLKSGKLSTSKTNEKRSASKGNGKASTGDKNGQSGVGTNPQRPSEDYSVFKPSCSRLVPYSPTMKAGTFASDSLPGNTDKPRIIRQTLLDRSGDVEKDEKTSSSRAARANQRRIMKGVAAIGVTSLGLDTLASREPQLRFDRSGIHAWGVFADEDIATGEMIVEYRGELIGNAMAEKREKEYEIAKIGSDYMFRIDSLNVCDATKQGNVARFLNASCGPNCYTKIITLDGSKRIVIYTKRDIRAGEELCYDYKFPLEYDESQRIPCHCGTKECRGFMNWDKRYVAVPASPDEGVSHGMETPRGSGVELE
jgi:hypothetical protein